MKTLPRVVSFRLKLLARDDEELKNPKNLKLETYSASGHPQSDFSRLMVFQLFSANTRQFFSDLTIPRS